MLSFFSNFLNIYLTLIINKYITIINDSFALWMKFPKNAPHPDSLLQSSTVLNSVCFILRSLYGGRWIPVVPPVGSASSRTWLVQSPPPGD